MQYLRASSPLGLGWRGGGTEMGRKPDWICSSLERQSDDLAQVWEELGPYRESRKRTQGCSRLGSGYYRQSYIRIGPQYITFSTDWVECMASEIFLNALMT